MNALVSAETPSGIATRAGRIPFPAYAAVTTFGGRFPLDDLIRPYLPRLVPCVMVSPHYAKALTPANRPPIPVMVDSGGFAGLLPGAEIIAYGGLGCISLPGTENEAPEAITPGSVLEFQETIADLAFTLDLPIPPGLAEDEARRRQDLTIRNALWALQNRRRRDLPLYAVVQAWDAASATACASAYRDRGFDGVAIGGLVPRARDADHVMGVVGAVREALPGMPLHVFGLGGPETAGRLFAAGVQSIDSSGAVRAAADGRLWQDRSVKIPGASPTERLHLALLNIAYAAGRSLPLQAYGLAFRTSSVGQTRPA